MSVRWTPRWSWASRRPGRARSQPGEATLANTIVLAMLTLIAVTCLQQYVITPIHQAATSAVTDVDYGLDCLGSSRITTCGQP